MAKLEFEPAPGSLQGRPYTLYRDWLNVNFYEQLCSYCLLQFKDSLQIEHHEPRKYAAHKIDDPENLLLACSWCNSGKKDYHPHHADRTRLKNDNSGYTVIDIREEDFAALFELAPDGELRAKPGSQRERIKFNIVNLLRLNIDSYKKRRGQCLEYVNACEGLVGSNDNSKATQNAKRVLVKECAERYLFLKAFGITLSASLQKLIEDYIEENKPKLIS